MKRWNVTEPHGTLKLYYKDYETAKERNPNAINITENFDFDYLKYVEKIKSKSKDLLYDYRGRKVYKIPYNGKYILIRLWSELEDGKEFYYDGCQFQKHNCEDLVVPITWECSNPKDFYEKFLVYDIQNIEIECQRQYGQPKLKKPKECNNKNLLGSINFSFGEKTVKCKVWKDDHIVYVLHRDWFSDCISFDEAERRGLIDKRKSKFIYDDNFGGVVLRNEAVLSFGIPNDRHNLVKQFSRMLGTEWSRLPSLHRWEDFFSDILKLCEV